MLNGQALSRRRNWLRCAALAAALTTVAAIASDAGAEASAQTRDGGTTLYQRLGRYDGISSFIALVFPRVAQHPELAHLFRGHGKDSQQRQFQLVVELICQKTGGPCVYIGRPMPPVHDGLGISDANWAAFMKIITDGMEEKRYPPDVRAEFLEIWKSFRGEIVRE